jgi:hypothetical protein
MLQNVGAHALLLPWSDQAVLSKSRSQAATCLSHTIASVHMTAATRSDHAYDRPVNDRFSLVTQHRTPHLASCPSQGTITNVFASLATNAGWPSWKSDCTIHRSSVHDFESECFFVVDGVAPTVVAKGVLIFPVAPSREFSNIDDSTASTYRSYVLLSTITCVADR